jgi:hypothetical protein
MFEILPLGVVQQSPDGFVQELTPEYQEKMRQSIIKGRASVARMTEQASELAQMYPEMAGCVYTVLASFAASGMQFESIAAMRWGVEVKP